MKTVKELQQFTPISIDYGRIRPGNGRPQHFSLAGELGFRLSRSARRIEEELPYSREYLLSQITGAADEWSNFPRVHADIAGRWVLAETYLQAGRSAPSPALAAVMETLLKLQNEDGSFGIISFEEEPLNMHKAYGNGWMIKALSQYAITFEDESVCRAAVKMGEFYERTFPLWAQSSRGERDTNFYAISISCYYHAFDAIVTLYQLTEAERWLDLAERYIPHLTPLEDADHSHMYLTIRRGLLRYYGIRQMDEAIRQLASELQELYATSVLESGGMPERLWLPEGEHADDEACSLFDWEMLATMMFEASGDTCWLDYAILNLENQIFYNQTYNGGFGSCELGGAYKQQSKEAPWCCSVFGPYGLLETGAALVHFAGDTVQINHLISGEFTSSTGDRIALLRDDEQGLFTISTTAAPGIRKVKIYSPHWLELTAGSGTLDNGWFVIEPNRSGEIVLQVGYRLWLSNKGKAPKQLTVVPAGEPFVLFYGPWMLTHRFHEAPVRVKLALDDDGYVTNFERRFLRGMNFYGQSIRVIVPSDIVIEPADTFRGVHENSGALYMYPVKDKESPNQSNSAVYR